MVCLSWGGLWFSEQWVGDVCVCVKACTLLLETPVISLSQTSTMSQRRDVISSRLWQLTSLCRSLCLSGEKKERKTWVWWEYRTAGILPKITDKHLERGFLPLDDYLFLIITTRRVGITATNVTQRAFACLMSLIQSAMISWIQWNWTLELLFGYVYLKSPKGPLSKLVIWLDRIPYWEVKMVLEVLKLSEKNAIPWQLDKHKLDE